MILDSFFYAMYLQMLNDMIDSDTIISRFHATQTSQYLAIYFSIFITEIE